MTTQEIIKNIVGSSDYKKYAPQFAEVISVDEAHRTCEVKLLIDETTLYDVRLQSAESPSGGIVSIPKVGSSVVIILLSDTLATVVSQAEINKFLLEDGTCEFSFEENEILLKKGTTKISVTSTGIEISRSGVNLKSVLNDVINACLALTVTCTAPGSPSSPPINAAQFIAAQTQLNLLLS